MNRIYFITLPIIIIALCVIAGELHDLNYKLAEINNNGKLYIHNLCDLDPVTQLRVKSGKYNVTNTPGNIQEFKVMALPKGLDVTPDGRLIIKAGTISPLKPLENSLYYRFDVDYAWEPSEVQK